MSSKKVIIFMVDGTTDEASLGHVLSKLCKGKRVCFQIAASILNKLIETNKIGSVPYKIYYFSTKIEHIMHDIQNAEDTSKRYLAEKVEDRFYDNPSEFISFINNQKYAVQGSYEETWKFIKEGNNSLKRYTNFNLFFEKDRYL